MSSNDTPAADREIGCATLSIRAPVAQRIEHLASDQRVGGSSPSGRATLDHGAVTMSLKDSGQVDAQSQIPKSSTSVCAWPLIE